MWNRRVAKVRKDWLKSNNELDPRDLDVHSGEIDVNVVSEASFVNKEKLDFEKRQKSGR
mgnify:CR=1 FL=1